MRFGVPKAGSKLFALSALVLAISLLVMFLILGYYVHSRMDTTLAQWPQISQDAAEAIKEVVVDMEIAAMVAALWCLVLGGILLYGFVRLYHEGPITRMENSLTAMAEGNVRERVALKSQEELAGLFAAANACREKVLEMVSRVRDNVSFLQGFIGRLANLNREVASAIGDSDGSLQSLGHVEEQIGRDFERIDTDLDGFSRAFESFAQFAEQMNENLRTTAELSGDTSQFAHSMVAFTETLSDGIKSVSERIADITFSVNEAASGIEEMSMSLKEVSNSCVNASNRSNEANVKAQSTNDMVARLNDSANEVGKIVGIINDIAEQTDMLALNATIEAAEAGETGRRFAVVAHEVKELANRTSQATEQIAGLVREMQANTGNSVDIIKDISGIIQEVTGIYRAITLNIDEQSATINEIARVVSLAARSVGEISSFMDSLTLSAGEMSSKAQTAFKEVEGISHSNARMVNSSREFMNRSQAAQQRLAELVKALAKTRESSVRIGRMVAEVTQRNNVLHQNADAQRDDLQRVSGISQDLDSVAKSFGL